MPDPHEILRALMLSLLSPTSCAVLHSPGPTEQSAAGRLALESQAE